MLKLELAFWFALVTHGVGLISMALLVMPGMPGGLLADQARIEYLAMHPYLWRLGWLPWQLSALSDLLLAFAFTGLPSLSKTIKTLLFVATFAALIPDQCGQFLWITEGVELAKKAAAGQSASAATFLSFEQNVFVMVCGWASLFYTVLAILWTKGLSKAGVADKLFVRFSTILWIFSFACSALFILSRNMQIPFLLMAISNTVLFAGLMFWFCYAIERILRSCRKIEPWGREAKWQVPSVRSFHGLLQILGGSKFLRRIFERIPPISLSSDIDSVVYVNYLLPAEKLLELVPAHLELQRLGANGDYALFSILTFRHQHFGPQMLGNLRKLMFNSIVSNWRIHVTDPAKKMRGIYFLSNTTDNAIMSVSARILSEAMPMHLLASADFRKEDESFKIMLNPGDGSAPDLEADLKVSQSAAFSGAWSECFKSFEDFLEYCVPQDRSISSQPILNRITYQEIELGIPLTECKPLAGSVLSNVANLISGPATPFCFSAPALTFRFNKEHYRSLL